MDPRRGRRTEPPRNPSRPSVHNDRSGSSPGDRITKETMCPRKNTRSYIRGDRQLSPMPCTLLTREPTTHRGWRLLAVTTHPESTEEGAIATAVTDITCPHCGESFPLTDAIRRQIEATVREEERAAHTTEVEAARAEAASSAAKSTADKFELQLVEARDVAAEQKATITDLRSQLRDLLKEMRSLRAERENEKLASERSLQEQIERRPNGGAYASCRRDAAQARRDREAARRRSRPGGAPQGSARAGVTANSG